MNITTRYLEHCAFSMQIHCPVPLFSPSINAIKDNINEHSYYILLTLPLLSIFI